MSVKCVTSDMVKGADLKIAAAVPLTWSLVTVCV